MMKTLISSAFATLILVGIASAQTPVGTSGTTGTTRTTPPATTPATTTASPSAAKASVKAAPPSIDYKLAMGDKLRVDVYKDAQLSQTVQVRPDGKITMPLIGDIPAVGRTSTELRDAIASALSEGGYIKDPTITVIVTEMTPQLVYVTGEVTRPGSYVLVNGQLSILQALAMAGGFTDFANKKDIRVLRKGTSGMQTLKFNYKEALESTKEPLQLQAGDTVVVK